MINCPKCKNRLELCLEGKNNFKSYICVNCDTEFYDKGDGKMLTKDEFFKEREDSHWIGK